MLLLHRLRRLTILHIVISIACFPGVITAVAPAENERKPIVTSDLLRLRTASDIAVSSDDSFAVLAVRSIAAIESGEQDADNAEPHYAYRSHLYLLDLAEPHARPRQLTHGARNDRDPQISPDGRFIAFVRRTEDTGRPDHEQRAQVWVLPVAGGEARQVTSLEHGASRPRWSPDGRQLLVTSSIPMRDIDGSPGWPRERPMLDWNDAKDDIDDAIPTPDGSRESIRAWLEQNAANHNPKVITRLNFQDEQRLHREKRFRHLYLVDFSPDAEPGEARRITDGFVDHHEPEFVPNGRAVVYVSNKRTDKHPDRVRTNAVWMRTIRNDAANTDEYDDEPRKLLAKENWRFRAPTPSGDGSVIALLGQKQDEPNFRQWQLGMASMNHRDSIEPIWLTDEQTFDYSVRRFRWHPERAALLFNAGVQGGFPLMTVSPGLLKPAALIDQRNGMRIGVHSFGVGRDVIVYAQTSPSNPCVVRVRAGNDDRLVFDLNEWVHERKLAMPQEHWLERDDGTRVHYWIIQPTRLAHEHSDDDDNNRNNDNDREQTYPLVLQIHGGPSAMWGPGELTMWHEFQLMASWGYGVVYANPRGSGGYGSRFQRANFQDWGHGPAGDVLAALDRATELDWVDPDRFVVTGGSYAGYLTAWIVAHDHRFRAAIAQRGVYHLPTFFGEGNAWRLLEWAMGGRPHEPEARDVIERESPFNYVRDIETPLLIMHASEDLRTGVSQSEMLYRALKTLERPVEYVRYPGAGHDLSRSGDPHQRMDRLNRIIEFFERHIDNQLPAPSLKHPDANQETDS